MTIDPLDLILGSIDIFGAAFDADAPNLEPLDRGDITDAERIRADFERALAPMETENE